MKNPLIDALDPPAREIYEQVRESGGGMTSFFRVAGLTLRARNDLLYRLEEMGLVARTPNGNGPNKPWWWMILPGPPAGGWKEPQTEKGTIYDLYEPNGRPTVWCECRGVTNEFGCVGVVVKAGANNAYVTWLPPWLFNRNQWWYLRGRESRGEVTDWSKQFSCPIHGECTEATVTTTKCCAICGTLLIRHV